MKYVVINVYDREVMKVGVADTLTEATEILRNDFMRELFNVDEFGFDACIEKWELKETEAWMNTNHTNYDWKIIEVD